jgi:hypothetical protein
MLSPELPQHWESAILAKAGNQYEVRGQLTDLKLSTMTLLLLIQSQLSMLEYLTQIQVLKLAWAQALPSG